MQRDILRAIDGDVVYASKLMPMSYGLGLLHKIQARKPLVADIDDWSVGHWLQKSDSSIIKKVMGLLMTRPGSLLQPNASVYMPLMERLVGFADQVTVTSSFLQSRFGGTRLPHGRDLKVFDPSRFDRDSLKKDRESRIFKSSCSWEALPLTRVWKTLYKP